MPLSEFNLRSDNEVVPAFLSLMRDDGYIYAEDLAAHKVSPHQCVHCQCVYLSSVDHV